MTRNVAFFSRASARVSAVRSVRPVLLRLSTSRRVLISSALNNLSGIDFRKKLIFVFFWVSPVELVVCQSDVVETEFDRFAIVVVDFENRLFRVGGVWRLERKSLWLRCFGHAIPAETHFALVEERGVVLVLIHHRVESKNSCSKERETTLMNCQ